MQNASLCAIFVYVVCGSAACLSVPHFSQLPHKRLDCWGVKHEMHVSVFSATQTWNVSQFFCKLQPLFRLQPNSVFLNKIRRKSSTETPSRGSLAVPSGHTDGRTEQHDPPTVMLPVSYITFFSPFLHCQTQTSPSRIPCLQTPSFRQPTVSVHSVQAKPIKWVFSNYSAEPHHVSAEQKATNAVACLQTVQSASATPRLNKDAPETAVRRPHMSYY